IDGDAAALGYAVSARGCRINGANFQPQQFDLLLSSAYCEAGGGGQFDAAAFDSSTHTGLGSEAVDLVDNVSHGVASGEAYGLTTQRKVIVRTEGGIAEVCCSTHACPRHAIGSQAQIRQDASSASAIKRKG